ncbi:MAG: acyl transferase [Chitinophagaceae bacterium]|nr:MAG: acyl transferase [Chitinophagaceae bacterium]
MVCEWSDKIFGVTESSFETLALEVFQFQYQKNTVYKAFVDALGVNPSAVNSVEKIPFLPIQFFKTHKITTTSFEAEAVFESSGTTQLIRSKHFVKSLQLYQQSFITGFENIYGSLSNYCVLGLLPSYLEQKNSSLVFMVNNFIQKSNHPESGFYLYDFENLANTLKKLEKEKQKTLLLGVSFALLDFAAQFPIPLQHTIVMETGGMKGRQEEITRASLHAVLKKSFQSETIHSEYGMTELLSQAYSAGAGIFNCPQWMKILIREKEDPLQIVNTKQGKTGLGAFNIIDLANVYSCSFIATEDVGNFFGEKKFELLGRLDNSELRGCSQLVI